MNHTHNTHKEHWRETMTDFTGQLPTYLSTTLIYLIGLGATMFFFFFILLSTKKVTFRDLEGQMFNYAKRKNLQISFGTSENWRYLREMTFKIQGKKCLKCGQETPSMHVDHIRPKSTHPHLEYMIDNLQVLCPECNKKKSFTQIEDHRKPEQLLALLREINSNKLIQKKYVYDQDELVYLAKNKFKKEFNDEVGFMQHVSLFRL